MVVHDVLKLGTVSDLFGRDGPFSCLFKAFGDGLWNLPNYVAGTVVGDGSVDAIGPLACAEPCSGLVFGGGKTIDICGQRANNLL